MKRIPTGIKGLDDLIEGGFIEGDAILVVGGPGTGKTTFVSQFLYMGAKQYNEPGIYISLEEPPEKIRRNMLRYGWDFESLEKENKIRMIWSDPTTIKSFVETLSTSIRDKIEEIDAKRLVIDSITVFLMFLGATYKARKELFELITHLSKLGCTTLLTAEMPHGENKLTLLGIEEFVADGIIKLDLVQVGVSFRRSLTVLKMRGTRHDMKVHPFDITEKGIVIYPAEELLVK